MKVNPNIHVSQLCWVCQKPHAKRKCPATNNFICSLCCGSKRKKEIDCPDDCQYLIISKNHRIKKIQLVPAQIDFWRNHFDIINNMNFTLLEVKKNRLPDLKNSEVKDAIENLIKTYETEERGIIYEYKSPNYRIQSIYDNIENIINRHRQIAPMQNSQSQSRENRLRKIQLDEIVDCLKFVSMLIKQSISRNISETAYFDFIYYFTSNSLIDDIQ